MKIATCSGKSILMDGHDFVLDGIRASEDLAKFCARLLEQCSGLQTSPIVWMSMWVKCKELAMGGGGFLLMVTNRLTRGTACWT